MNKKQTVCLGVIIALVVLMGLFPPVTGKEYVQGHMRSFPSKRYKSIFALGGSEIARTRLCLQWLLVVLAGSSLILPLKDKKPKDKEKKGTKK